MRYFLEVSVKITANGFMAHCSLLIECWICGMRGETALIAPETVGQYTGLKDKNGTKIFEGDILREPAKNDWEKSILSVLKCFGTTMIVVIVMLVGR